MTTAEEPKQAPSLLRQISHYFSGQVAIYAAGLISMPIFARLMGKERWGTVNLVISMMFLLAAFGKFGLSHATVRFAGRPKPGQEREERALQSSLLMLSSLSALVVCLVTAALVWWATSGLLPETSLVRRVLMLVFGGRDAAPFMIAAGILVLPRTLTAILWALQRSEQRSKAWTTFGILLRYGALFGSLLAFLAFRTVSAYFVGVISAECLITLYYLVGWWRSHHLSALLFSPRLMRMCLAYGLPLIIYEIATVLVNFCDRFIIAHFQNQAAVGLYSAGYGLAEVIVMVMAFPIELAVTPYCFRLWDEEGAARTSEFIATSAARYAVVAFPVLTLFAVSGRTVIWIMSGREYIPGAAVIPWVLGGMAIWFGFYPLVSMGFLVHKRSAQITMVLFVAVILNAVLNWVLVPRIGYEGAAIATFLTYVCILLMTGFGSARYLKVPWRWGTLARSAGLSLAIGAVVWFLPIGQSLPATLVRVLLGAFVYARIMLALDADARWTVTAGAHWLRDHNLPTGWLRPVTGAAIEI